MSEALYRKYRPQTFDDVVGQTHIERTLKNAIESDKVSHAYLFCGPRGTGKTTTARLLAKALLCEDGPTPAPDGTCEQCVAIAEGTHPDVNELDAASRTGVENVREEIIGRVQYAPTHGRSKIYIIDEVHMLSTAAFNALLKTLEEPPSHVVFILCTTDPQKVPDTIHSRCQRFDFHRLSNEEIVSRLGAVCMAEGVEFEGDALDLVAHRAQGGMRDALTTLEQLIAFGNGAVTVDVARNVLGSFDVDDMSVIAQNIAARDAAACFTWMAEYVETGADLAQFARDLATYMRDLYVLMLTDGAVAVSAAQSSLPRMAQEAEQFGTDRLAYILRVLGDLNTELRSAANPRLSFEIALTRMVRPSSDLTLEALAARVEALEAQLASGVVPVAPVSQGEGSAAVSAAGSAASAAAQAVAGFGGTQTPARSAAAPAASVAAATSAQPSVSATPSPAAAQTATAQVSVPSSAGGYRPVQPAAQTQPRAVQGAVQQAANPFAARAAAQGSANPFAARAAASAAPGVTAAQDKSAVFRAEMERRRASHGAAQASASQAVASVQGATQPAAAAAAATMPEGEVSDALAAKLSNPASLQRGWQATLAELKRQRAAYGALLLSARVNAAPGGKGIAVVFSKENSFAYSAAQKPDISAALTQALALAFGEAVPFVITQAQTAFAAAPQQVASASQQSAPAQRFSQGAPAVAPQHQGFAAPQTQPVASHAAVPASSVPEPPAWEDDVVPYDDADVAAYEEGDAAPFDEAAGIPAAQGASQVSQAPQSSRPTAQAPGALASEVSPAPAAPVQQADPAAAPATKPESARAEAPSLQPAAASLETSPVLDPASTAWEPRVTPVDPYDAGMKLGFTSMPSRKLKKSKSLVKAKGWPGIGKPKASQAINPGSEGEIDALQSAEVSAQSFAPEAACAAPSVALPAEPAPAAFLAASASSAPDSEAPVSLASVPEFAAPAAPARPNPFAQRAMPRGIGSGGNAAPSPLPASPYTASNAEEMPIEDIFGAFGVSMQDVIEER